MLTQGSLNRRLNFLLLFLLLLILNNLHPILQSLHTIINTLSLLLPILSLAIKRMIHRPLRKLQCLRPHYRHLLLHQILKSIYLEVFHDICVKDIAVFAYLYVGV